MDPIPVMGHQYHFFDDGKITTSRHFLATVTDIITPEQAALAGIEYVLDNLI